MSLKTLILGATAMAALALPAAADNGKSLVPGYPDVVGEYIQIPGYPAAGTPKALNTASFLRLRAAADGEAPKPANAVIVGLPGFSSTPAHWLYLASSWSIRRRLRPATGRRAGSRSGCCSAAAPTSPTPPA
ncbi:MAG: hypothetical protein U1E24_05295 [Phenylobacterium sp.]|nr:hypothetical protein [Phenylobacterium sp.]